MILDREKILKLIREKNIPPILLSLKLQVTPMHMNTILRTGQCCEEIAHSLAEVLNVKVEEII